MKKGGVRAAMRAAELLDLPGEAAPGVTRVTVTGGRRAFVENHRGLLEYTGETVVVNTAGMLVKIRGTGLEITAMSDLELVVTGSLSGVEFLP